jgi:dephospho-CoA kinase
LSARGPAPAADRATAGPPPLVIGLTGPIGCGKSTIARMLAELGAMTIDADEVAREVTEPGTPALSEIRARFGDAVLANDGSLDRAALARLVFADPKALRDLEQIVHPRVREIIDRRLRDAEAEQQPLVAIEAIKLVEAGLAERCGEVWLVECAAQTQRARLAERGMAAADIERRLASQGPDMVERLVTLLDGRAPARVLATEGGIEGTRELVEDALAEALLRRT